MDKVNAATICGWGVGVLALALVGLAAPRARAGPVAARGGTMVAEAGGAHDFDFLFGAWKVRNRRLRERLQGSTAWEEFEATNVARPLPGGIGNEDEFRTDFAGGFVGMSFRFYDRAAQRWAIYWADSRKGVLDPPVLGSFAHGQGVFLGADTFLGRPIQVRFIWSRMETGTPRWEQAFSEDGGQTWETNWVMDFSRDEGARTAMERSAFPVVELRRYATKVGEEEAFARHFESFFPEAFQQLGAIVFGQFQERGRPSSFTWLRGYRSLDARATVGAAFYDGPVWKEHKEATNARITDSDNVLLLQPLRPERGLLVLPAVGQAAPQAPRGITVAQIFAAHAGQIEALAAAAEPAFAAYRAAGAREAGVLVTLDVANNFPRHPIRGDGPYLVWLGLVENDLALRSRLSPLIAKAAHDLQAAGLLRSEPELVVMDPTPRSRLRWLREQP